MGDWKSSAIGGSDAEVMKSGVSKCTCLCVKRGDNHILTHIFLIYAHKTIASLKSHET